MRESQRTEKTRLPGDTYEGWSESQTSGRGVVKHRNPPKDTYEAWVEKLVRERLSQRAPRKRRAKG